MGTNELALLQLQSAREATRGTDLAATRKAYAQFTPTFSQPLMDFMDTSGTFDSRRRVAYGRQRTGGTLLDICTYEDLPYWLQGIIKGSVAGAGDGGAPVAYTYAFTPTAATDDLQSFRLEFGETGNPYEMGQVMFRQATLRMDSDNDQEPGWMIDGDMIGRDLTTSTFTGALGDRTTEVILARGTKIYIDSTGGTIGTTQKLGSLISASITIQTGVHYKAFAEDVTLVAANKVGRSYRLLDAQFTFEFDSDIEFANYRSAAAAVPVQRLIRMEQSGPVQIHGAAATFKRLRIDMYGYWNSWSRADREGNLTATFGLAAFYDATATKAFTIEVVNALATLV